MNSGRGQIQAHPTTQVYPSDWMLQRMMDHACAQFDASVENERIQQEGRAEAARVARERAEAQDRAEAAIRHNRRVMDRGLKEALEHGCHPKPRDGGILKFRKVP